LGQRREREKVRGDPLYFRMPKAFISLQSIHMEENRNRQRRGLGTPASIREKGKGKKNI